MYIKSISKKEEIINLNNIVNKCEILITSDTLAIRAEEEIKVVPASIIKGKKVRMLTQIRLSVCEREIGRASITLLWLPFLFFQFACTSENGMKIRKNNIQLMIS